MDETSPFFSLMGSLSKNKKSHENLHFCGSKNLRGF